MREISSGELMLGPGRRTGAAGLRLFEGTGPPALEKLGVDEVGARTSPRFR